MNDCPTCEYHKQRAKIWRDEAYRLAGHPLPEREKPWVGLTRDEQSFVYSNLHNATLREDSFWVDFANAIEKVLKEKNNG
jgi:hypothetical protein